VVRKNDFTYLGLKTAGRESYILEKYDYKVIITHSKQIFSKCTLKEFVY